MASGVLEVHDAKQPPPRDTFSTIPMATSSTKSTSNGRKRKPSDQDEVAGDGNGEQIATKRVRKLVPFNPDGVFASLVGVYDVFKREPISAAYLGFSDIGDLRRFVASHVFLEHFLRYKTEDNWSNSLFADSAFDEIKESFLNPAADASKYPVKMQDRPGAAFKLHPKGQIPGWTGTQSGKKGSHKRALPRTTSLAYILILMVEDLDAKADFLVNPETQESMVAKLNKALPHVVSTPHITEMPIKYPKLKTAFVESELEPYSRAMVLLRYAQYAYNKTNWKRMSKMELRFCQSVTVADIPHWMQPHPVTTARADHVDNGMRQGEARPVTQSLPSGQPIRHRQVIDLTTTPEPHEMGIPLKRESPDLEERPEPNLRVVDDRTTCDLNSAERGVSGNGKGKGVEDDAVLQSQLEEAKLRLEIVLLERKMAARKKEN
ncbi:hypothetical protein M409DRAFT_27487 [Zasmidium cellare ATCC 36951]|uniref:Uncharacterized protein n=1 Tax=Zasmidium cellare ATCC 36951 TaxID=1080233 RepID=A0A6A6C9I0_ZASCE|nr:uncharacterized protein M409DRAFT_27487 [Zasmidium cellare ATCC 36951]KAF2162106.1 hypothetical protein M409DRAFT_27487 [Zasmidium cellare ATCC 36951]